MLEGCYSVSAYDGDEEGRREKLLCGNSGRCRAAAASEKLAEV